MTIKKAKLLYFLIFLVNAPSSQLIAGLVTIDMDNNTMVRLEKMTQEMVQGASKFKEEFQRTLPVMRQEASIWFKDAMPELEKSLVRSGKDVTKALRLVLNPLKMVPILGMGLAGSVAAIMMLRKGLEKYLEADDADNKELKKGRKLMTAGLIGIFISSLVMIKSDSIVKFFSA
jgi:hypothetical protein